MTAPLRRAALIAFLCISATVRPALAQNAPGFALNRFEPAERGSEWFALESLDLRGQGRLALGIVGDWGHKPLALYAPDGSERSLIVRDQVFIHPGAGIIVADRFRFSASLPIAVHEAGDRGALAGTTYTPPSNAAIGDLRLGADARLVGTFGDPFTAAIGVQVQVPTGSQSDYTGDGKVRIVPRLLGAGDIGPFVYAVKLGIEYRALDGTFANSPIGTEVLFGAAAGIRTFEKKLVLGPELYGSTVVANGDAFFKKKTTPVELIIGGHGTVADDFRIGAGIGPGLTRGFGTPQFRILASFEWIPAVVAPPPPPSDRDGDGVLDAEDACPDTPGVKTEDPKTNGCPPPSDRDKDGILDAEDACPDTPGVKTEDPKTNGCPPPSDRDKDGIVDPEDACPDVAGPRNEDPKKNGCPEARIEAGEIKILQQVKFKTASAEILAASDATLNAVLQILREHPEIDNVRIEGHTDNRGGAAMNMGLSSRRAASVVKWLVQHGIDKRRLTSQGFGLTKPLDSNDTDEGRQANRRVEFHIEAKK